MYRAGKNPYPLGTSSNTICRSALQAPVGGAVSSWQDGDHCLDVAVQDRRAGSQHGFAAQDHYAGPILSPQR